MDSNKRGLVGFPLAGTSKMGAPKTQADAPEAERLDRYLWFLIAFVCITYGFDAYDTLIMNLALPYLGKDFDAGPQSLGYVASVAGAGTMASFVIMVLADRFGRRPVLLYSIVGYSLFSFLTAFSTGLVDYGSYQFLARTLLVGGQGISYVILAEELPAGHRGFGIGLMFATGIFGGIVGSALFPVFIGTTLGWRIMYLLGIVPVGIVLLVKNKVRETRRWLFMRQSRAGQKDSPETGLRAVFRREHRKALIAVALMLFCTTLWYSAIFVFWTYFAINERGWSPQGVSKVLMGGLAMSMVSQLATGIALDRWGRRITSYLLFSLAALSAFGAFRAESPGAMSALYMLALASVSIMTVCLTIASELFPTEIRASANAVANNLLGRIGIVIGPSLVGMLSVRLGSVGEAVSLIGLVTLPCVAVVYFLVPETRGKVLEEIQ